MPYVILDDPVSAQFSVVDPSGKVLAVFDYDCDQPPQQKRLMKRLAHDAAMAYPNFDRDRFPDADKP